MLLTEDIREKLAAISAVIAEEEGLKLFDLTLARRKNVWDIRAVLDRLEGYVTVGDCARVSRRLIARLELEDILAGDYKLEVSSPGLDRRLRDRADYERFKGQTAKLFLRGAAATEVIVGRITEVNERSVKIARDEETGEIPFDSIKKAVLEVVIPGFGEKKKRGRRKKKTR